MWRRRATVVAAPLLKEIHRMAEQNKPEHPGQTQPIEQNFDNDAPAIKFPKKVRLKNNGIRHRVMTPDHGLHTIEKGDEYDIAGDLAFHLLTEHDQFDLISASDGGKEFDQAVKSQRKLIKERREQRERIVAAEAEEARLADEQTARERGKV